MIKTFLKIFALSVVVLLLGQIRWEGRTIADRFHAAVTGSLKQGGKVLERNQLVAKLSRRARSAATVAPPSGSAPTTAESETLTDADRESLRRLLQ